MSDYSNSPQTREQIKEVLKPGQMTFIDTFEHLVEMPNMPKLAEVFTDFKKVLNWISELNDDPDNQRFLAIVKSLEDSPDIRLQAIAKMLLELPIEDLPEMSQRYLYLVHNADTPKHAGDVALTSLGTGKPDAKQPTEKTRQRAEIFKSIKDRDPSLSYAAVAMRANKPEFEAHRAILGNVSEDDIRNAYRAMNWDWVRADKIK